MSDEESEYLRLLPAVHASRGEDGTPSFVERYLMIAESLLGRRDGGEAGVQQGMAALLDALPSILSPRLSFLFPDSTELLPPIEVAEQTAQFPLAPTEEVLEVLNHFLGVVPFVPPESLSVSTRRQRMGLILEPLAQLLEWLSGWIALVPIRDWSVDRRRDVLSRIMPLYRKRGTLEGLKGLMEAFFDNVVVEQSGSQTVWIKTSVVDMTPAQPVELGTNTTLAETASPEPEDPDKIVMPPALLPVLDGMRPHSFVVGIYLNANKYRIQAQLERLKSTMSSFVDEEKPVHARCSIIYVSKPDCLG
ncbi:phage tail protein [Sorangium atrum]|uniref:Phage tail protein n=1 Tax=Sorangium atrum TaxID=2995308 RepID=A0ABT5BQ36_9BACT|nr:phage tail protein [Sorangium aterium]MDC0676197.1 phage tail protein [Sorangium aterium]